MREIKFRLLLCDMVVGYEIHRKGEALFASIMHSVCGEDWKNIHHYFEPILHDNKAQFTGLHDKNGKEIYEGDIVNGYLSFQGGRLPTMGAIVWSDEFAAFAVKNEGGETLFHNHFRSSFEVVGNIYENRELLEE